MELERSLGRDKGAAGEKDGQVGTYLKLRDGDRQASLACCIYGVAKSWT